MPWTVDEDGNLVDTGDDTTGITDPAESGGSSTSGNSDTSGSSTIDQTDGQLNTGGNNNGGQGYQQGDTQTIGGKVYTLGADGQWADPSGTKYATGELSQLGTVTPAGTGGGGSSILDNFKKADGSIDWSKVLGAGAAVYGGIQALHQATNGSSGANLGPTLHMDTVANQVLVPDASNDPNRPGGARRPGSASGPGRTGMFFSTPGDSPGIMAALQQQANDQYQKNLNIGTGYNYGDSHNPDQFNPNNPAHQALMQQAIAHIQGQLGSGDDTGAKGYYNNLKDTYHMTDADFAPYTQNLDHAGSQGFTPQQIHDWSVAAPAVVATSSGDGQRIDDGGMQARDANGNIITLSGGGSGGGGGMAAGGSVRNTGWPGVRGNVVPYNTKHLAHGGIAGGYLQGSTDGMADQVPAVINGHQPARLAHGEFVWPADVVSHLGNGNSDAGAQKLYQAMQRIRKARTGSSKQGKQIDPNKFIPGMSAGKGMAAGGIVDVVPRFDTGGLTTLATTNGMYQPVSTSSGVSDWAAPYVGQMLDQSSALGNDMMQNPSNYVYGGERTAGPDPLQTQAATGASNLASNPNITSSASALSGISSQLANTSYDPTSFTNNFQAPTAYDPTQFQNQYTSTAPYQTTQFTNQDFTGDQVAKYMNPYLQQSLDPQIAEARRQAQITKLQTDAGLVGSGAFGGGRQAVMDAEGDRNLLNRVSDITGAGYNTAYTDATAQFNTAQQQNLASQQATEQSKQFGANLGVTNAANTAQYGQQAANATEGSKQYGSTFGLQSAQAQQAASLAAQQASEQSKQFGANLGLQGLEGAASAANQAGNLGIAGDASARANIATQAGIGGTLQGIAQAGDTSDMNKFNEEAALPGQALQFEQKMLTGLPISSSNVNTPPASAAQIAAATGLSIDTIQQYLNAHGSGSGGSSGGGG